LFEKRSASSILAKEFDGTSVRLVPDIPAAVKDAKSA